MINIKNKVVPKITKIGLKDNIGYMLGDLGGDSLFMFIGTFLMVFYTDILGIKPALVGMIFLIVCNKSAYFIFCDRYDIHKL